MNTRVASGLKSVLVGLSVSFAVHAAPAAPGLTGACFFSDHMGTARCVDGLKTEECKKFPASVFKPAEYCAHHTEVVTRPNASIEALAHSVGRVTLTGAYVMGAGMPASATATVEVGSEKIPFSTPGYIFFNTSMITGLNIPFESIYHAESYLYDNFCKSMQLPAVPRYFVGWSDSTPFTFAQIMPLADGAPARASFVYGIVSTDQTEWGYYAYVFCDAK